MNPTEAPLRLHQDVVRPEWIDYNGHMNVAYYVLAFDHATDALFDLLGVGRAYVEAGIGSVFVLEAHVNYIGEVTEGCPLAFETQILDHDDKRLHFFHRMINASTGETAATTEILGLHVSMANRRAAPFPPQTTLRIGELAQAHATLPRPPQVGKTIAIGRKPKG